MGVPTQKRTKSSAKRRASHFALKQIVLNKCPKCGKPVLPHRACEFCGTYKGKQVLTIKTKKKSLKQKDQERKAEAKAKIEKKKTPAKKAEK